MSWYNLCDHYILLLVVSAKLSKDQHCSAGIINNALFTGLVCVVVVALSLKTIYHNVNN
jgi:hypothetical protein